MSKHMKIGVFIIGLVVAFAIGLGSKSGKDDASGGSGEASAAAPVPAPPPPKHLNLSYGFSRAVLFNHDFSLTNTSGEDLNEVHLAITFIGEDASPELDRYWSSWPLGVKQEISIPMDRVKNVQRITVRGKAEEGIVLADLTPRD